jgi:nicotinate-nucleotide adenylyltransferase
MLPPVLPRELAAGARIGTVLVFGGSFDPVHRGHVAMAAAARAWLAEQAPPDEPQPWIVFVPAGRSPHKTVGPIAPGVARIEMLRAAWNAVGGGGGARASERNVCVWDDELRRSESLASADDATYTIDTVRRLHAALVSAGHTGATLRLLIGADQALGFHRWREPRAIIDLAEPVVMVRGVMAEARHLRAALARFDVWTPAELDAWATRLADAPAVDASSTQIRTALTNGDWATAQRMLDPAVLEIIRRDGLYTSR